jgi:hypothetical protein
MTASAHVGAGGEADPLVSGSEDVIDRLRDLDDRWNLECEFTAHVGPAPARWIMFPSCCPVNGRDFILGCERCMGRKTTAHRWLRCDICGARFSPASLAWRRVELIR